MNIITKETTKEQHLAEYKNYPDTQPEGFLPFHASRVNPIFWDIPDNSSVLDIGCNSGEFMKKLIDGKKGVKVKGIDLSQNVVKIAQGKGLDVVLGDGETLPFPDASFDYVVLMEVIVHVHEPRKMLAEIKRVLKKDGVLIGSAPHKNLEMNIWDDRRMHHAYYTTEELSDLLYEFFPAVYPKVLKGGQFSMGMAGTYLGDKDAEILFKAGSTYIKPWDYAFLDKDVLRVWMGPTQNSGDVYYRMQGYADKMNQMERCDILYNRFDSDDEPGSWQAAWQRSEGNRPANMIVAQQMEGLIKHADLTVWQLASSLSVLAFFHALKSKYPGKPFITECDDWLFDVPSYNIASNPYRPGSQFEEVAFEQFKMSDAIIVSTQFIKDHLLELFPGKQIYVIPNSIDFQVWDSVEAVPLINKEPGRIRIGYTGSGNHGGDLEVVKEPILAILDEFPNVEFITAGAMSRGSSDDKQVLIMHDRSVVSDRWTHIKDWPAAVKGWQMDIGIAPLRDSNFNRAKSNLRWLEYGALGIPTVASKVYPFEKSIKDGKDGYLCLGKQSWYDALRELVVNEQKRKEVGQNAYRRIKKESDMDKVARSYKSVLEVIKRDASRSYH